MFISANTDGRGGEKEMAWTRCGDVGTLPFKNIMYGRESYRKPFKIGSVQGRGYASIISAWPAVVFICIYEMGTCAMMYDIYHVCWHVKHGVYENIKLMYFLFLHHEQSVRQNIHNTKKHLKLNEKVCKLPRHLKVATSLGASTASILKVPRPWTRSNLEFAKSVVDVLCKKAPWFGGKESQEGNQWLISPQ